MRLLRLDFDQGPSSLDLHPFTTVVSGLDRRQKDELLETIRELARGMTAGIRGLIHNEGLLVELDGRVEDSLTAVTGANVVIDCDAIEAAGLAGLRSQIDRLERRAEVEAVIVEEIRANLDFAARARVARLEQRLAPDEEIALLAVKEQERELRHAIERIASHEPILYQAEPEVLALRNQWEAYAARRAGAEDHFAELMAAIEQSDARVRATRQAVTEAEQAAKPVLLNRTEEARLEALCFPENDETRKGRWRKTLSPDEEVEKQALLDKVGVESWTGYTLYRASPVALPERVEAAAIARRQLERDEEALVAARERLDGDQLTTELNAELDAIRDAARPHLGQLLPSDLSQALEKLVVGRPNPDWLAAVEELTQLAITAGAVTEPPATDGASVTQAVAELVATTEAWLHNQERSRVDVDEEALRAELVVARRSLVAHERGLVRLTRAEMAAEASALRLSQLRQQLSVRVSGGVKNVDAILALAAPVAAQVELEAQGSVPIAVVGRFDGLDVTELHQVMAEFDGIADRHQILVVSDNPDLVQWVEMVGPERALHVSPKLLSDRPAA